MLQGAAAAGANAVAAEGAFAGGEIQRRVAAVAADDDALRAGLPAVVAAAAGIDESRFGKRPGRAVFSPRARSTAKEAAPRQVDHVYCTAFILSMPLRSIWSISEPGSTCGNSASQ